MKEKKSRLILIIILFSLPLLCWAQKTDWENPYEQIIKYSQEGNYQKAIEFALQACDAEEKEFGKGHVIYATSLSILASLYAKIGDYTKAESLYIEALAIRKQVLGENHPDYASLLHNLAGLYDDMGNYAKAEPLYIEAIAIRKKALGDNHPGYANSLLCLAQLYHTIGNYAKAESLFIEAMSICRKALGENHPYYALSLNNLAALYNDMGNYVKAEFLYIEATTIAKKVLGENHPDYATSLNSLAELYSKIGNYSKSEPLDIEALAIKKKALGENHPDYAASLNTLAALYYDMGNYAKAEPLYNEALAIRKIVLGEDHPDYANSLNNLALLYLKIGNYVKAKSICIEALAINKNALDENHPLYANSLNTLAGLYNDLGDYAKVEPLYIEAIAIRKKALGENHPDYATLLNNLASFYTRMGNYAKAEPLYTEEQSIYKKVLSENHPLYATSLNNLALLYKYMGNCAKAESLYIEATAIFKKALGENHPDYANSLNNLALLYHNAGNYVKAEPLYRQANDNINNQIRKNFSFMTETEKELFFKIIESNFKVYNSFALCYKSQKPDFVSLSYNNELAHKGMLLSSSTVLRQAIYNSIDSVLINIYDRLINIRKTLSKLYVTPIAERKMNIDSLENESERFEKELLHKGKELSNLENIAGVAIRKWQDIQQALKSREAAIEFVNFNYYDNGWTDSIFYCALVLRKEYSYPKMIYLFEEKQLQELLSKPQATNSAYYIKQLYSNKSDTPSVNNKLNSKNILYCTIWQPIDSLLEDINTIYLAPSGILNKVAFNAIPITDSTLLSDKYQLNIVSSTRILAFKNRKEISFSENYNAALYGGIEYDIDSAEMIALVRQYQNPDYEMFASLNITIPEDKRNIYWSYIPGTLTEVRNIDKLFKSFPITCSLFTGKNATEESFKHLTDNFKSPEIIHMATHGFFFPDIKPKVDDVEKVLIRDGINEPIFRYSENPLFRSGILLAGASRKWQNFKPITGVEDGVLTAYEVSNTNLINTKLVVLSACETGLGDIKGSEGVYGLQRAFKMAGVRYIVMSLWQVPDYQTSELMQLFYANCINGMTIKEGFKAAQQTMRKKYDPSEWAAFVLIE